MRNDVEIGLEAQIAHLAKELKKARGRRTWLCGKCDRRTQIGKLALVVSKYYVEPFGCTGGDYYTEGSKPTFYIVCPKCSEETREYEYHNVARRYEFVMAYRHHFGDSAIRRKD